MFSFFRQVFRGFTLVSLCAILIPLTVFAGVVAALIFFPLPATMPVAKSSVPSQATKIYDVNGELVKELRTFDMNIPMEKSDVPETLKNAVIASEDKSFYRHKGIDLRGISRALWADFNNKKAVQGGSTITQQYVKLVYTNREVTLTRKVREAILASQLDRQMPKDEILYRYLSEVYFGGGAYGAGAAAESYFHKPVKDLNVSEAAMLVGLIPAPHAWEPRANREVAESRRKLVLEHMLQEKFIDQKQYEEFVARPLWLEEQGTPPGPVTMVYPVKDVPTPYPYFTDYVQKYLEVRYGPELAQRGGLRVQTTLDPAIQDAAEKAVADRLKGTKPPLSMALASVEPQTGFVRAVVGGRDYNDNANGGKVNLALGGCPAQPGPKIKVAVAATCWTEAIPTNSGSGRQPGSSFKAFVLAAAYEKGTQPTKVYPAGSVYTLPAKWCRPTPTYDCRVKNAEGEGGGSASVKEALVHSYNTVYVPLALDTGLPNVASMAKKLGVDSMYFADQGPSFALGTTEVSPLEMAGAYAVFANNGVRLPATPVVKVVDPKGKVLEDNSNREGKRVISAAVADNVTDAMRGVIERGTGNPNANIGRPAAGKTGTTESFGDAWFVGYTPTLSTAVWMGNNTNRDRINYKGNRNIYGGTVPTQTWASFMKAALSKVPQTDFNQPAPITRVNADVITNPGATTIPVIAPQQSRSPITTPTGDYDETIRSGPSVSAPALAATPTSAAPAPSTTAVNATPTTAAPNR